MYELKLGPVLNIMSEYSLIIMMECSYVSAILMIASQPRPRPYYKVICALQYYKQKEMFDQTQYLSTYIGSSCEHCNVLSR
jgi:hypothetical protein